MLYDAVEECLEAHWDFCIDCKNQTADQLEALFLQELGDRCPREEWEGKKKTTFSWKSLMSHYVVTITGHE